jgi:hypothetical protein
VTIPSVIARFGVVLGVLAAGSVLAGLALASPESGAACARGYSPCLPVKADLDCADIPNARKPVRVTGADPYGLDADRNGLGCKIAGVGGGRHSPWGLILRKPPRKEARRAKPGDTLTAVGWSPSSFAGARFRLCNVVKRTGSSRVTCSERFGPRGRLEGTVQTFGTWRVRLGQGDGGVFKLTLRVNGKVRAADTVPLR